MQVHMGWHSLQYLYNKTVIMYVDYVQVASVVSCGVITSACSLLRSVFNEISFYTKL